MTTAASAAGSAPFRIPNGTAPTAPVAGDVWVASSALWYYSGTNSYQFATINGANSYTARQTHAPTATIGTLNVAGSADPSGPASWDIWGNSTAGKLRYFFGSVQTVATEAYVTGLGYATSASLASYAPLAGATFTGAIITPAATTASAFLNLPHGTQPTTPNNGDVFTTTSGLFARINGSTLQFAAINASTLSFGGTSLSFGTSAATSTINVGTGATTTGVTKTIAIGTAGVAGSTTNITVGTSSGGTSTITLNGTVNASGLANGVKAWVNFNGTGTVAMRANYNVSSITDNGVGDYTINFTTAMADTNYLVINGPTPAAGTSATAGVWFSGLKTDATGAAVSKLVGSCRVVTAQLTSGTLIDCPEVYFAILR